MYLGKIYSQDFHFWYHWYYYAKYRYDKDLNGYWHHFYTPLHNPTSTGEKIVKLHYYTSGSSAQHQLWGNL